MDNLKRKITITRDARFEAYRRMKRRKISSTVSLAMLSLSIIFFNILQLLSSYKEYNDGITAVTIMLSSLVLTMSLLVSGMNYGEKEHQYFECAVKLSKLLESIRSVELCIDYKHKKYEGFKAIANRYHTIIAECPINHIGIDYEKAKERNGEIKSKCETNWIWISWNIFDVNFLYWLLAILMPVIAWIMIFSWNIATDQASSPK